MAPLGFRVVRHGLYTIPFFVNPSAAHKSGCDSQDIDVQKFLIPHAYAHTASGIRPEVHIVHTWYAEHRNSLGSCPDPLILAALRPTRKAGFDPETASLSIDEYDIPTNLSEDIRARLAAFEDLSEGLATRCSCLTGDRKNRLPTQLIGTGGCAAGSLSERATGTRLGSYLRGRGASARLEGLYCSLNCPCPSHAVASVITPPSGTDYPNGPHPYPPRGMPLCR